MEDRKLALYNFEWQSLRTSLDFSTYESTSDSIVKLTWYVKLSCPDDIHATFTRIHRALNLMSAVRMGFSGSSKIASSEDLRINIERKDRLAKQFREIFSNMYRDYKMRGAKLQFDSTPRAVYDLRTARKEDLNRVYASLLKRWNKSGQAATRPELGDYVGLIEKVRSEKSCYEFS